MTSILNQPFLQLLFDMVLSCSFPSSPPPQRPRHADPQRRRRSSAPGGLPDGPHLLLAARSPAEAAVTKELLKPAPIHGPIYPQVPVESQPRHTPSVFTQELLAVSIRAGPMGKRRSSDGANMRGRSEEDRLRALCLVSPRPPSLTKLSLHPLHHQQTEQIPQEDSDDEECTPSMLGAQAVAHDDHACITLLRLKMCANTGSCQASPNDALPTPSTVSASSCGEHSITAAAEGWSACDRLGLPVSHSLHGQRRPDGRQTDGKAALEPGRYS